jgi:hypothetical protein
MRWVVESDRARGDWANPIELAREVEKNAFGGTPFPAWGWAHVEATGGEPLLGGIRRSSNFIKV